jgi:hypothetical protein
MGSYWDFEFPRIGHTAKRLANGQILVAGGEDSQSHLIAAAELYNPATGTWAVTGSLATPRIDHAATLLANGDVLIAGGVSTGYTATAELYNPSTGQWRTTGSMTVPRAFAGVALLRNCQVLMPAGATWTERPTRQPNSTPLWQVNGQPRLPCQAIILRPPRYYPAAKYWWSGAGALFAIPPLHSGQKLDLFTTASQASEATRLRCSVMGTCLPTETSFPVTRRSTSTPRPIRGHERLASVATASAWARWSCWGRARSFSQETRSFTAVTPLQRSDAPSMIGQPIPGHRRGHCYKPHVERRHCLAMEKCSPSAAMMRSYTRLRNDCSLQFCSLP